MSRLVFGLRFRIQIHESWNFFHVVLFIRIRNNIYLYGLYASNLCISSRPLEKLNNLWTPNIWQMNIHVKRKINSYKSTPAHLLILSASEFQMKIAKNEQYDKSSQMESGILGKKKQFNVFFHVSIVLNFINFTKLDTLTKGFYGCHLECVLPFCIFPAMYLSSQTE